jgi:replicative DNA helicase
VHDGGQSATEAEVVMLGANMRMPPANVLAEQALLGAIMATPKAFARVDDFLKPEHFADPVNGRVFAAAAKRIRNGQVADVITLRIEFENTGALAEVGGLPYLAQLQAAMVSPLTAAEYGHAIHETWIRRQLIETGEALVNRAFGDGTDTDAVMTEALGTIEKLLTGGGTRRRGVSLDEAMDKALALADQAFATGGVVGLSTGMPSVDRVLGGLEPSTLNALAGRTGSGKSSMGQQWAISAARRGAFVVEFSLEMSAAALGRRVLSSASGVPIWRMRQGKHQFQADQLIAARKELAGLPLVIHDGGVMSAAEIMTKCRVEARKQRIDLIVVDHLHLVEPEDTSAKHGPTAGVTQVANTMLAVAKQFQCPVLLLAQLNRAPSGRDDHRPVLADLRQSGAIEQNADTVSFVYRPEQYIPRDDPPREAGQSTEKYANACSERLVQRQEMAGKAELVCEKVRDGEPSTVQLRFDGQTASFKEATNG